MIAALASQRSSACRLRRRAEPPAPGAHHRLDRLDDRPDDRATADDQ